MPRPYGKGSLTQDARGRWRGTVSIAGKRYYVYAATKSAAAKKLSLLIKTPPPPPAPPPLTPPAVVTLASACATWLGGKATLRQGTRDDYARLLAHAQRHFGASVPLAALSRDDLLGYRDTLVREHASHTVRNYLRPLLAVLAAHAGPSIPIPRSQNERPTLSLSVEQAQTLLQAVAGHRLEGVVRCALATGMRAGEITALRWRDIDLARGTAAIRSAHRSGQEVRLGTTQPKTAAGVRVVPLIPLVTDYLRTLPPAAPDSYVFHRADGKPLAGAEFARTVRAACQRTGIPCVTFHELRHSNATILIERGVPILQVSALLGHANVGVTLGIYAHLTRRMEEQAIQTLAAAFGPQNGAADAAVQQPHDHP